MFKFNLEPVLSLKQKIEDSKKRELGEATTYKERVDSEKQLLIQSKLEALSEAKNQGNSTISIASMKAFNQYSQYMDYAIEDKNKELIEAQKMVDEKRSALLEAVKDRKILDNLKAIQREIFNEEEKREEQRILDDMVTYRFGIKGKE